MNPEIQEKFPDWAAKYMAMSDLLGRLHVARIMLDEKRVGEILEEIDNFFRSQQEVN